MQKQVTMTAERLQAMADNGMELFWTPGAPAPYWAARASWANDEVVATPIDFARAEGYDSMEGFDGGDTFTLTVQRPE